MLPVVIAAAPPDIPYLTNATIDGAALWFADRDRRIRRPVGLAPALMLRTDLQPLLHSARTSAAAGWVRHALVAVQVGLALVRSSARHCWPKHVAAASVSTRLRRRRRGQCRRRSAGGALLDNEPFAVFDQRWGGFARSGVAAASSSVSSVSGPDDVRFAIEAGSRPTPTGAGPVPLQAVTPGFFETMRIPVLQGRSF